MKYFIDKRGKTMNSSNTKLLESDETEDGIIIDGGFEDVSDLENDLESQINSITQEFGGQEGDTQFKINIYRILENKGERAYLFSCLPNELPIMEKLINDYGGGTFDIWIYKNGKIFKRKKVIVEPPIKIEPEIAQQNDNVGLSMIMQGLNKLTETIANNSGVVSRPENQVNTMQDLLQNMTMMKTLMGLDNNQPQNDLFSNFKKFAEMQQIIGSSDKESNSNDVFMKLMETFGEPIAKISEKMLDGNINQIPDRNIVTGQYPQQKRDNPQIIEQNTGNQNPMKMHLIFLTGQAKADNDPEIYAQMVVDNTQDKNELKRFITSPTAIDDMAKIHPPVGNYPGWFTELGEIIRELLIELDQETLTTTDNLDDTDIINNQEIGNQDTINEKNTDNGAITRDT